MLGNRMVVTCVTEKEANEFCSFLKNKGICWNSGDSLDKTNWKGEPIFYKLQKKMNGKIGLRFGKGLDYKWHTIISCAEFIASNTSILDIRKRTYNEVN